MDEFLDRFWGSSKLFLDDEFLLVCKEELLAAILACDGTNLDRFMSLEEFRNILSAVGAHCNIHGVQQAQVGAINAVKRSKISKRKLTEALKKMSDERVIDTKKYDAVCEFLYGLASQREVEKDFIKENFFHAKKDELNFIFESFLKLCSGSRFENRLQSAKQTMDDLSFTVAVTGIINSGKSSLLNALLNKKILGSSNVPETTNLSVLRFGKKQFSKVNFWSEAELKELRVNIDSESLRLIGKSKEISTQDLKQYTSSSSPLCVFVKSVEIYEDLEILKDGVRIVDTPGIDDAIFLRERLVNDFITECDLMAHLMNASQAATQKDLDFIEKSLTNSRVSRLVIVLTHADLFSDSQLKETLAYVQKSVRGIIAKFDVEVDFFVVSSRAYFENASKGGIKELKSFLYEIFFGEDSKKAMLCVSGFKRELNTVCDEFLSEIKDGLLVLSGSNFELNKKLNELKAKEEAIKIEREALEKAVATEVSKIDISRLQADFKVNLQILSKTVAQRVLREMNYEKKKNDKRIFHMISSSLNDGIMNLFRQNRNEILSQLKVAADNISIKLKGFDGLFDCSIFNVSEYLEKKGIFLGFSEVCGKINENTLNVEVVLGEFLSAEWIKNSVLDLVEYEKEKFIAAVHAAAKRKEEDFRRIKSKFEDEINLLNGSSVKIVEEIARLSNLKTNLEAIEAMLKNA